MGSSPALLPLYLRSALPRFGTRPVTVPEVTLRLTGLRPQADDVAAYAAVVRQPRGDRIPLLYPHLLGFGLQLRLMTDPAFPFAPLGLVHVSNDVTELRALRPGAELDVAVHATAVRPHARGRVVDVVTEVREDGEPVWYETSTYLRRERTATSTDAPSPRARTLDPGTRAALHFSARWRLPADLGRRYAGVSGDINPIHLTSWTARPLGFPRAIAHGMWTAAAVLATLDGRLPDALRCSVQFRRPIHLPATVRLFTAITGDRVDAEVRGPEGDDRPHLTATLRPAPPSTP